MKNLRTILVLLFVLLLADSSFSQRKFSGRVIEVIDGKTVVVEMESGKLTAVLQYIEIPDPEQPLYRTVRDHLEKLVLGKYVDFQPQGVMPIKTLGQLYLGGVDIAQQMVRDGAAWHLPADQSGQDTQGSAIYQNNQAQAKSEKRGIWSIENLKPAWQFRADKKESVRLQERLLLERSAANGGGAQPALNRSTRPEMKKPPGVSGDTNPALKNVGATPLQVKSLNTKQLNSLVQNILRRKRPLFINVWASWCPYCRSELPDIKRAYQKYGSRIDFIVLSVDDASDLNQMTLLIQEENFRAPLYWLDSSSMGTWMHQYGEKMPSLEEILPSNKGSVPRAIVYNRNGRIVYNDSGQLSLSEIDIIMSQALN